MVMGHRFLAASVAVGSILLGVSVVSAKEIARVNQVKITENDLLASLGSMNEGQKLNLLKDQDLRQKMVLQAINQELMAQEAEKLKLDEDQEFKKALKLQRKQLLLNTLIEKKIGSKLTASEIRSYYEKNKSQFATHLIRIQQILVSTEAQAKDLFNQAKRADSDFQALAEAYSIDPSAKNNRGEVGFITSAQVDPVIWNAANSASVGSVTGPVKNPAGYHILKVVEKKMGKPLEYAELELQVRVALRDELVAKYLAELRKSAKINVDQSFVSQQ